VLIKCLNTFSATSEAVS